MNWRIKFGYSIFTSIFLKLNNAQKSKQYNPKMARQAEYHHTLKKNFFKLFPCTQSIEENSCKAISHYYKKSNFYSHPISGPLTDCQTALLTIVYQKGLPIKHKQHKNA